MRCTGSVHVITSVFRQERSNELIMVGRGMVAVVDELLAPTDRDFSASTHIDHVRSHCWLHYSNTDSANYCTFSVHWEREREGERERENE